jgi:hypothetical protein
MRIFEITGDDSLDKFLVILRNQIGRSSKRSTPAPLSWEAVASMAKSAGFEAMADSNTAFSVMKDLYDTDPVSRAKLEQLVKNYNQNDGLILKVPGAPDEEKSPTQGGEKTSQDAVDQMAASAAPQQLAAQA